MGTSPWIVSDELWECPEPLLSQRERRYLPKELGFGSGMACWRHGVRSPFDGLGSPRSECISRKMFSKRPGNERTWGETAKLSPIAIPEWEPRPESAPSH